MLIRAGVCGLALTPVGLCLERQPARFQNVEAKNFDAGRTNRRFQNRPEVAGAISSERYCGARSWTAPK
jgi:hypothetical protein